MYVRIYVRVSVEEGECSSKRRGDEEMQTLLFQQRMTEKIFQTATHKVGGKTNANEWRKKGKRSIHIIRIASRNE